MTYSGVVTEYAVKQCINCGFHAQASAKFCGGCGSDWRAVPGPAPAHPVAPGGASAASQFYNVPAFAQVQATASSRATKELHAEAGKIMVLLARERIFLYLQWVVFLGLNLTGVWVACKCYHEFLGDEISKLVIASTPFLFINTIGLLMVIPIKGTRNEIARLKEKLAHLRFQLEFGHLGL